MATYALRIMNYGLRITRMPRLTLYGKIDKESRSLSGLARFPDDALVRLDDSLYDRKPQPHSLHPGGEERPEDASFDLLWHAGPRVGELDHSILALLGQSRAGPVLLIR